MVNLLLVAEPLRGWRTVLVSEQRTRLDFARCIQELVDIHYPDADQIVLVLDQLNTHSPAALYAAFPPAEAKASPTSWRFITRRSMGVGSTWPSSS